ncbi:hypothetical protein RUM43_013934 [Polyplax serrata]|uniref:Uncharacterized protein n=1 Tax=Polyplax serrata TaxID=468196 RepID=A0AAN8Q2J6_POLSC
MEKRAFLIVLLHLFAIQFGSNAITGIIGTAAIDIHTITPAYPSTPSNATSPPLPSPTNGTSAPPLPSPTNATAVIPTNTTIVVPTNTTGITPSPSIAPASTSGTIPEPHNTTSAPVATSTSNTIKPQPHSTTAVPIQTSPSHVSPESSTTPLPIKNHDRHFDGPSFIGGIVLTVGLTAIGFIALKFYKADRGVVSENYRKL